MRLTCRRQRLKVGRSAPFARLRTVVRQPARLAAEKLLPSSVAAQPVASVRGGFPPRRRLGRCEDTSAAGLGRREAFASEVDLGVRELIRSLTDGRPRLQASKNNRVSSGANVDPCVPGFRSGHQRTLAGAAWRPKPHCGGRPLPHCHRHQEGVSISLRGAPGRPLDHGSARENQATGEPEAAMFATGGQRWPGSAPFGPPKLLRYRATAISGIRSPSESPHTTPRKRAALLLASTARLPVGTAVRAPGAWGIRAPLASRALQGRRMMLQSRCQRHVEPWDRGRGFSPARGWALAKAPLRRAPVGLGGWLSETATCHGQRWGLPARW